MVLTNSPLVRSSQAPRMYPTIALLPVPRYNHVSFLSQKPENPRVVVCGGRDIRLKTIASCLVLNQETQTWDTDIISDLTQVRAESAVVRLKNIGTYVIGGSGTYLGDTAITTDFLPIEDPSQWIAEVEFVHPVSAGGSVKFLPAV